VPEPFLFSEVDLIAQTLVSLKITEGPSRVILLVTGAPLASTELGVYRCLAKQKCRVLSVCVDRPASFYLQQLGGALPPEDFYAVEVGTAGSTVTCWPKENRVAVDSAANLIEISRGLETISKSARSRKNPTTVVLSALSTFSLYHDTRALGRFLLDQLNRFRATDVLVVILLPPSPELERVVRPMADRVIEMFLKPEERLARAFG